MCHYNEDVHTRERDSYHYKITVEITPLSEQYPSRLALYTLNRQQVMISGLVQQIPQCRAKSQLEFVYVCMYVCMNASITLKNVRMSPVGMQFYTTDGGYRLPRDYVRGDGD